MMMTMMNEQEQQLDPSNGQEMMMSLVQEFINSRDSGETEGLGMIDYLVQALGGQSDEQPQELDTTATASSDDGDDSGSIGASASG